MSTIIRPDQPRTTLREFEPLLVDKTSQIAVPHRHAQSAETLEPLGLDDTSRKWEPFYCSHAKKEM